MANNTPKSLRQSVLYSVYVRCHTAEGTFRAVIPDLDRIRDLGCDIIWFMPIHPIGVEGKKGSLGCPYANRDYRTVNPAYGTMEDFRALVDAIHERGMLCMIDVVYNHTSPDSTLSKEHPEFFYHDENGNFGNKVGDWADVIDLDYSKRDLWAYQIESLKMWARIVDGFRCDVASLVPLAFWEEARAAVEEVHPGFIWLAESIHGGFNLYCREHGFAAIPDSMLYRAFDMEYEYDIREVFDAYLEGKAPLSAYTALLTYQDAVLPDNHIKLRYLENHDLPRIASIIKDPVRMENFLAMLYFLKGTTLLYAGQEWQDAHQPSLFEQEVITRDETKDLTPLLRRLAGYKKDHLSEADYFTAQGYDREEIAVCRRSDGKKVKYGIFCLQGKEGTVLIDLPDGSYRNEYDGGTVTVRDGKLTAGGRPIYIG